MSQETERYQLENNGNTYLARAKAGGGGTNVVANPEGTATEDLTKLQVGEDIYDIPIDYEVHSYTADTTYTGDDLAQLRDDISHFRMIKIGSDVYHCIYAQANATYWYVQTYNVASTIYMNKVTIGYDTGNVSAITTSEVTSAGHLYEHTITWRRDEQVQKAILTFKVITNTPTLASSLQHLNEKLYELFGNKPIEASGSYWLNSGGVADGYWNITSVVCMSNSGMRASVIGLNSNVVSFNAIDISIGNSSYTTITTRQII